MADMTMTGTAGRAAFYLPRIGFGLAVLALALMVVAPLGWRGGIWNYRISFFYMMVPAAFIGIAAGLVSLVALFWWGGMGGASRTLALIGLVIGAVMFYLPYSYYRLARAVPRIHDISTDMQNPPAFTAAVMAARAAEQGDVAPYTAKVAALQEKGYPDLGPVTTTLPPAEAYPRALAAAQRMAGWTIVATDPAKGMIEGYQRSTFYGFTDDFVIRVAAQGTGSRIDMRSDSRQGLSDLGVNAKRIRAYMAALKERLGTPR